MAGKENSSLTRVQPVFGAAIEREPTGTVWLPALLRAVGAQRLLGALDGDPGMLIADTVATSSSKKADWKCFEVRVPPDRRLLRWAVEHADTEHLTVPPAGSPEQSDQLRRQLICDEPRGARELRRAEARAYVDAGDIACNDWRRFERETEVDCVLETDRLVLCIEGKRNERLARHGAWIKYRNQIARNLEAARRIAGTRRQFAVLVCAEDERDPLANPELVSKEMPRASPHLFTAERDELIAAYLGQLTWLQICKELNLNPAGLPNTVEDVPGCRDRLLAP